MQLTYKYFILLLPIISLGYFYDIFRNWGVNASIYPLFGFLFLAITLQKNVKIHNYSQRKAFLTIIFTFLIVTTITTFGMSIYIEQNLNTASYETFKQPLANAFKTIPRNIIVFSIFLFVFAMVKSINDIRLTITYLYKSFFFIIAYGYVQILSILDFDIFKDIYGVIWPYIDSGWAGENRTSAYIYGLPRRVNVTMPEASEVSHYFQSAIYPFLLASIVSKHSVFNKKIFNTQLETYIFIASIPVLLFTISSSGYFVLAAQIFLALILYAKYHSTLRKIITIITITATIISIIFFYYYKNISEINWDIIIKVFDTENGSSNTRYALTLAGLGVFSKYPLFGVGPANTNYFMEEFIPGWANNNYEITHAIETQSIPILNYWVDLLASFGITGSAIYFYLMLKTITPYKKFIAQNDRGIYIKCSFYLYLLSTIMHGFNSSNSAFIYIWSLWAFYICLITTDNLFKNNQ